MAGSSSSSASSGPACYVISNSTWKKSSLKASQKQPLKNLNFLFKPSLPLSSPFPLTLKPSSSLSHQVRSHPLLEETHLENPADFDAQSSSPSSSSSSSSAAAVFFQDPPWIPPLFLRHLLFKKAAKTLLKLETKDIERRRYDILRRRQVVAETEAWERTVEEYAEIEREMRERQLAPNLPHVKALFSGWFEPLRAAIEKEQKAKNGKQKLAFAPNIDCLPAGKMAVIVMHKMMGLVMVGNHVDGCVQVVQAAVQIGMAIEHEVRIHSVLEKSRNYRRKSSATDSEVAMKEKETLRKNINGLMRKRKLSKSQRLIIKEEFKPWTRDVHAKLGCRLIELLTETAYVHGSRDQSGDGPPDVRPAFRHRLKAIVKTAGQRFVKNYGVIECDPLLLSGLDRTVKHIPIPYVPMLIPPRKWRGYDKGGHLFLPSYIMRTHGSRKQQDAMKSAPRKQMKKVFEALDMLGSTKWRVNKRVLSVVESLWAGGGNLAGLVNRENAVIPEKPTSEDSAEIQQWKWRVRKVKKLNMERHSLRCDIELKLSVARKMKDEDGFYYPHNLDFRGRAYPMHSHLNHLSSDLCRGVLEFAEGRPLGKSGLRWLQIHVANLFAGGVEKLPYDARVAFVENHISDVFDSANNPINGRQWWLGAEDPFQCLAACMNLSEALNSSSPETVVSHLPIHQDGSCNGLQHYAALGRDSLEAAAVNLVAGDKPADVYSEIAKRVYDIMLRDMQKDPATNPNAVLAKILIGQVDRKLVKQTVMTSVYGVTYVGAREQIKRRLEEKGIITDDRQLFNAACYAAKVTLASLGEIFQAARGVMSWLGDCAKVISSENQPVCWTTPLGLPVVQPYYRSERHLVRTSLQVLALQREGSSVDVRKQRSAFPPNYVHSLDGSHMMMTALACRDAGLRFAGVHDSFWTHACDVDQMNRMLREQFVELYSKPILENLLEGFEKTYPGLSFPSIPKRGDFDLQEVLKSDYFFN